ncbi:MAG: polymerase family protein [Ferruginibacter sp.]|nr:polymerase family protein [Ferruginibacter sp.]
MAKRFVTIWFRYLRTDWFARRQPSLKDQAFVLATPEHGRMIISAANKLAEQQGIFTGMAVADARALAPALEVLDDQPGLSKKLLTAIAEWCIRFTPVAAVDLPDGLILDATGCAHLWGGEKKYLAEIYLRLKEFGYQVRLSVADTIGAAWAVVRFGTGSTIIENAAQKNALLFLPAQALRIDPLVSERLEKLGLNKIGDFIDLPRKSLRRRFGQELLLRISQALGETEEWLLPVQPIVAYQERLPCIEPIMTAKGIEIALERLLDALCKRLEKEGKGLRSLVFKGYRSDGKTVDISIGTNRPSSNRLHLFKLLAEKIDKLEPAPGIELFSLDALKVEDAIAAQENIWETEGGINDQQVAELLDRIGSKFGAEHIHRYQPAAHYWPERSFTLAPDLSATAATTWKQGRPRPVKMLLRPEAIEVTAPIPDYPPMLFRYKGQIHKIKKADGPERIEQEWWLQDGEHRDYYSVEDEAGCRYWLFRAGHYEPSGNTQWFLHGFFA